jgi:stage V sporulation protein R
VVQDTDWRRVRDTLLDGMTNFGIPIIYVDDADYHRRGELLLTHAYDGKPLDQEYTSRTLKYLHFLWKRPVHLQTIKDDKPILFSHDGEQFTEQAL